MNRKIFSGLFFICLLFSGCTEIREQKEMLQGRWVCVSITGQAIPENNTVFLEIEKNRYRYSSTMNQEQGRYMLSEGRIYFIKDDRTEKTMEIGRLTADTLVLNATVTSMLFVKKSQPATHE